jgi:hypothetical protein
MVSPPSLKEGAIGSPPNENQGTSSDYLANLRYSHGNHAGDVVPAISNAVECTERNGPADKANGRETPSDVSFRSTGRLCEIWDTRKIQVKFVFERCRIDDHHLPDQQL